MSALPANPFLLSAQPLLAAATQLRTQPQNTDAAALGAHLAAGIVEFERRLEAAGVGRDERIAARYLLCTFIDDMAESTPWGSGGAWAPYALLMHFHQEAWGGERVFMLLSRLAEQPHDRHAVLELFHVCLSLGLQGKYRDAAGGARQLQELRARLFHALEPAETAPPAQAQADDEHALSTHWRPADTKRAPRINGLPLWALLSLISVVALIVYLCLDVWLARASDQAFASIRAIRLAGAVQATPSAVAKAQKAETPARFALALTDDLRERRVVLRDDADQSVISIDPEHLFDAASATLSSAGEALLVRVGHALATVPGPILVASYTDGTTARSALFPSPWHLTDAQSRAVARVLGREIDPRRLQTEGRGDAAGTADAAAGETSARIAVDTGANGNAAAATNAPAADPAATRRVDITLYPGR